MVNNYLLILSSVSHPTDTSLSNLLACSTVKAVGFLYLLGLIGILLYSQLSEPSYSCLSSQKSFPTIIKSSATLGEPKPASYSVLAISSKSSTVK